MASWNVRKRAPSDSQAIIQTLAAYKVSVACLHEVASWGTDQSYGSYICFTEIGIESAIIYHHNLDAFYKRSKRGTRWVAIQFGSIAVVAVYMQCGVGRTTLEAAANDEYRDTIDEVIKTLKTWEHGDNSQNIPGITYCFGHRRQY